MSFTLAYDRQLESATGQRRLMSFASIVVLVHQQLIFLS